MPNLRKTYDHPQFGPRRKATSFEEARDAVLAARPDARLEGSTEFDVGRGPTRLVHCTRRDAEYVSGVGVGDCIEPIDKVKVVGRVNWPEEQIEDERQHAMRMVGQIVF